MSERERLQRATGLAGAALMVIGMLTGFFVSAAMTGKAPADAHAALASHLNAVLGALWVVAVALTLPWLRYSIVGCRRLAQITFVANFANWLITAWKALWHVAGVDLVGEAHNDTIFGLLAVFVVVPALAAAAGWLFGFTGSPPATARAPSL
jgi:(hydroxyamino)benzene mutase